MKNYYNLSERLDIAMSYLKKATGEFSKIQGIVAAEISLQDEMLLNSKNIFKERILEKNKCEVLATKNKILKEAFSMLKLKIKGITVCDKPRKDGRFQGKYFINGKYKYFYGKTYDAVCSKIISFYKDILPTNMQNNPNLTKELAKHVKTHALTVEEWAYKWLEMYKQPNVKPLTYESLKEYIATICNTFGGVNIQLLSSDPIQNYLNEFKKRAPRKAALIYGTLRQMLDKAFQKKLISENPCDFVEFKKVKSQKRKAFTKLEQSMFVDKIKDNRNYFLFILLLQTGLRIGEALALTKHDFDLQNKTIKINKNVVFIKSKRIVQDLPKTDAGIREVPLTKDVINLYSNYTSHKRDTIFTITYSGLKTAFAKICKQLSFKDFSIHSLRHTYSTRLAENNVPDKVRQYLMGHATQEMTTNTYTTVHRDFINDNIEKITTAFDTNFDTNSDTK